MYQKYCAWREWFLPLMVENLKKTYINLLHPNRRAWNENMSSLSQYPHGSLGSILYSFLIEGNIKLEAKYESHDVYHVVAGYGLGIVNEARLFFFLLGNGKYSPSILGSVLVALVFIPEHWSTFYKDYKRGKLYKPLKNLDFEELLPYNFRDLILWLVKED